MSFQGFASHLRGLAISFSPDLAPVAIVERSAATFIDLDHERPRLTQYAAGIASLEREGRNPREELRE